VNAGALRRAGSLGAAVLVLTACAPLRDRVRDTVPVAEIDGIVIKNELAYPVHDVMIEVPATGGFAGCGMVLARATCSTSFPAAAYRREALAIRWTEYGEPHAIEDVVLDPPKGVGGTPVARLEVVIFAAGQAGARLVSAPAP